MELIDKAELMKYPIRINHYDKEHGNEHFVLGIESVLEFAEQLPTIDAVEVVRCCDCKYSVAPYKDSDDNVPYLYCYHHAWLSSAWLLIVQCLSYHWLFFARLVGSGHTLHPSFLLVLLIS